MKPTFEKNNNMLENLKSDFEVGKKELDSNNFDESLIIFDKIVKQIELLNEKNNEFKTLLITSLNNRGVSKCKIGFFKNNLELYKSGMKDYEMSLELSQPINESEKHTLISYINLEFAKEEIKNLN